MLKSVIRPILIGLIIGAVIMLAVLFLLAAIAVSVDIPPAAVVPLATVATALGSFIGGFASAKFSGRNGWLIGLLTAIVLFLMSTAAGFGMFRQTDGLFLMIKAAIMLACGMVGGIFAVNFGKRKRR